VREVLITHGLDVRNYERNGLTLVDHAAEIKNGSLTLNDFADKIQNYRQNQKNKLFVIADMSIHNHFNDTKNLLSLEKSLPCRFKSETGLKCMKFDYIFNIHTQGK